LEKTKKKKLVRFLPRGQKKPVAQKTNPGRAPTKKKPGAGAAGISQKGLEKGNKNGAFKSQK